MNKGNADISVIMPVYNAKDYLRFSIGDLLCQSFDDIELICVDDGSTDGSSEILDFFAKNDKRLHVWHKSNSGAGSARNFGMKKASGKYIYFAEKY